jgi:hypothetical protein
MEQKLDMPGKCARAEEGTRTPKAFAYPRLHGRDHDKWVTSKNRDERSCLKMREFTTWVHALPAPNFCANLC